MLTQAEADALIAMVKRLVDHTTILFPLSGETRQLEVKSDDGRESFKIDINRRGKVKHSKCTYQERYRVIDILVRLDVDGPTHDNPDGEEVPCPHLHLYREGDADKWAFPLPPGRFTDTADLVKTLRDFLEYCNVQDIPPIQRGVS
jgi:Family of unknown function (DUF6978)